MTFWGGREGSSHRGALYCQFNKSWRRGRLGERSPELRLREIRNRKKSRKEGNRLCRFTNSKRSRIRSTKSGRISTKKTVRPSDLGPQMQKRSIKGTWVQRGPGPSQGTRTKRQLAGGPGRPHPPRRLAGARTVGWRNIQLTIARSRPGSSKVNVWMLFPQDRRQL